jgi:hypothetical protein
MKKVIILFTVLFSVCHAKAQEAVDLGLSVKWATMNVGATSTSESGDNYHWGDTKKYSPNEAYFDSNNSIISHEGKFYNKVVISGTKYDVARQRWGGKWRMPTHIELLELYENCTKDRITINGKKYMKFTSSNGKSILLPFFSYEVFYWSATLSDGSDSHARCLRLSESLTGGTVFGDMRREDVAWIRPVMDYDDNEYSDYRERIKANAKKIAASGNSYKMDGLYEFARSLYYGNKGYFRNKKLAYYIIKVLADNGHEDSQNMLERIKPQ